MHYSFKLFIAGDSPINERVIKNLQSIKSKMSDKDSLEIIDIHENPQAAFDEKILATPALLRLTPSPKIKIIGDLSDFNKTSKIILLNKLRGQNDTG